MKVFLVLGITPAFTIHEPKSFTFYEIAEEYGKEVNIRAFKELLHKGFFLDELFYSPFGVIDPRGFTRAELRSSLCKYDFIECEKHDPDGDHLIYCMENTVLDDKVISEVIEKVRFNCVKILQSELIC